MCLLVSWTANSSCVGLGGLGSKGLAAVMGAEAFEVLGPCDPQVRSGQHKLLLESLSSILTSIYDL